MDDLSFLDVFPIGKLPVELQINILKFVDKGNRLNLLLANKKIYDLCLSEIWKPWDDSCKGLRHAVKKGYIGYYRRWAKIAPESIIGELLKPNSILYIAAKKGYTDFIKLFFKLHGDKMTDEFILNEFGWACRRKNTKVIRCFLKLDFETIPRLNTDMCSHILEYACKIGEHELVKILLEDGRIDPETNRNYCIKKACKYNRLKVVELLLDDGRADPNAGGGMPLFYATSNKNKRVMEALLSDWRIKTYSKDHLYVLEKFETLVSENENLSDESEEE